MKLFGWKGGAGAPRPVLSRGYGQGWGQSWNWNGPSLGEWPAQYEAQVKAAVIANPVAQRAVRLVSEAAGGAAIIASGGSAIENVRARELVRHVSVGQTLVEPVALHLLLHGNGYVQIACDAGGEPTELFALRPERVSVDVDARGWPVGYRYKVGDRVTRLATEDGVGRVAIVHLKSIHPLDDHYGLGCVGAASGPVAIHNAAARPSGALVYDSGRDGAVLSAEQFARLKAEMEAAFQGAANAGRPMLLEGGLKWQSLSMTPAEMDFVALKAAAAREIALAFGVPPLLLGLPGDSTYANYREANKALWRQTLVPLLAKILGGIAQGLRGWMPGLELTVDQDAVPELVEERMVRWQSIGAADFLTAEEKRAMIGIAPMGGAA